RYESLSLANVLGIQTARSLQRILHREIGSLGETSNVGESARVYCHAARFGRAASAQVGHVEQGLAIGGDVGNEGFILARGSHRGSNSGDVGAPVRPEGDPVHFVVHAAPDVSGVV